MLDIRACSRGWESLTEAAKRGRNFDVVALSYQHGVRPAASLPKHYLQDSTVYRRGLAQPGVQVQA